MIYTFPYHDPKGIFNKKFQKNFKLLKNTFSQIYISVTPPTAEQNRDFLQILKNQGFAIYKNSQKDSIADHSRNALSVAIIGNDCNEGIFFSFIDRVLFAFESKWKNVFLKDLNKFEKEKFLVFERSRYAWSTHPNNYREIEKLVSKVYWLLSGHKVELNPCGLILCRQVAETLLKESKVANWEIWGEWVLLALKKGLLIKTAKVDWLEWEDPFWENKDGAQLKKERELSKAETIKRIKYNFPILDLLINRKYRN